MTNAEKKILCNALDGLWGACENSFAICSEMIDSQDARVLNGAEAISKAQDSIMALHYLLGVEK